MYYKIYELIYNEICTMEVKHKTRAEIEEKPVRTGGQSGIRTHGTLARTPVFKTGSLNRSDICPELYLSCRQKKVKQYLLRKDIFNILLDK